MRANYLFFLYDILNIWFCFSRLHFSYGYIFMCSFRCNKYSMSIFYAITSTHAHFIGMYHFVGKGELFLREHMKVNITWILIMFSQNFFFFQSTKVCKWGKIRVMTWLKEQIWESPCVNLSHKLNCFIKITTDEKYLIILQ